MSKKSFFERLTGATKEEIIKTQSNDSVKRVDFKESKKAPKKTEVKKIQKEKIEEPAASPSDKRAGEWSPDEEGQLTIDVYQTENDVVIKSTIAGVHSDDLDVSITNDMITIKGIRQKDEAVPDENYYYQELYWGPFSRSVILPVDIDHNKVRASIKDGILTIRLPKAEKVKTKTITVKEIE